MPKFELVRSIESACLLGECALWDELRARLWWTDIEGKTLYSAPWEGAPLERHRLPERLGSFGFIENSNAFIGAFESGFYRFTPGQESRTLIQPIERDLAYTRLNDGRTDRQGRFWAGSMVEGARPADGPLSGLYCLGRDGRAVRRQSDILISNSLCWSPDGRRMYFADSPRHQIYAFDFDADNGGLGKRKLFATTEAGVHPDGSCVDAEGYLWNAQWGAAQLVRYAPDGRIDLIVELPCSQPTCPAFCGPALSHLMIATARIGLDPAALSQQPEAGNVLIYETPYQGLPESRCVASG